MPLLAIEGTNPPKSIEVDQIWLEVESNRFIKILEKEVYGTGPAWTYCSSSGKPEAHGKESNGYNYYDWHWHYCDIFDFCVWGRFKYVSG